MMDNSEDSHKSWIKMCHMYTHTHTVASHVHTQKVKNNKDITESRVLGGMPLHVTL